MDTTVDADDDADDDADADSDADADADADASVVVNNINTGLVEEANEQTNEEEEDEPAIEAVEPMPNKLPPLVKKQEASPQWVTVTVPVNPHDLPRHHEPFRHHCENCLSPISAPWQQQHPHVCDEHVQPTLGSVEPVQGALYLCGGKGLVRRHQAVCEEEYGGGVSTIVCTRTGEHIGGGF